MKKILFVAAAAAMMLVSCNKDNNVIPGGNDNGGNQGGNENVGPAELTVAFNELCGQKQPGKFIELYNNTDAEVDLTGWTIRKYAPDALDKIQEEGETLNTEGVKNLYEVCWKATAGIKIAANGYLTLRSDKTDPAEGFNAGLSPKKEIKFELVDATGKVVDKFVNGDELENGGIEEVDFVTYDTVNSYSRFPNGNGAWVQAAPTMGTENGPKVSDIESSKE